MTMETSSIDDGVVVSLTGRLDSVTTADFEAYTAPVLAAEPGRVVLNLGRLEYVSSAGLRGILSLAKELQKTGCSLALCGLQGMVEEVIGLSGLDTLLPVYDNLEAATSAGDAG